MGMLRRLALSFATISIVLYGLAIYFDPEGFYALFTDDAAGVAGDAASLDEFGDPNWDDVDRVHASIVRTIKLLPPDETSFDQGFLTFREGLRSAIQTRDLAQVLFFSDPDILLSLSGDRGRADLSELLEEPDVGEFYWQQLEDILELPSVASGPGGYCAPYVACSDLPEGAEELEPFETAFVVRENAPVLASPFDDAVTIRSLSFESVQLGSALNDPEWAEVVLGDGTVGFVEKQDIRRMIGPQAQFMRVDGKWRMTTFLADN